MILSYTHLLHFLEKNLVRKSPTIHKISEYLSGLQFTRKSDGKFSGARIVSYFESFYKSDIFIMAKRYVAYVSVLFISEHIRVSEVTKCRSPGRRGVTGGLKWIV